MNITRSNPAPEVQRQERQDRRSGLSIVNAALIVLIGLIAGAVVSKGIGNLAVFNAKHQAGFFNSISR